MCDQEQEVSLEEQLNEMVEFADKIVIDTCTLLDPGAGFLEYFWGPISFVLRTHNKRLTIPRAVYDELGAIRDNPLKSDSLRARAAEIRLFIQRIRRSEYRDLLELPSVDRSVTHADREILSLFDKLFVDNSVVVLTQDRNLATDLIGRAQTRSIYHKPVRIQLLRNGLPLFARMVTQGEERSLQTKPLFTTGGTPLSTLSTEERLLPPPTSGMTCFTILGLQVTLEAHLGEGGEGSIWSTNTPQVAKLYFSMSPMREAKLRRMLEVEPPILQTTTFPSDLLKDKNGNIVGVLMDQARGRPLKSYLFLDPRTQKSKLLPLSFTRLHLVRIARAIVKRVQALHNCGIIWGDINLSNVLLAFPEGLASEPQPEVWLVDIDCAQIEGFPCLVESSDFTNPFRKMTHRVAPYDTVQKTLEDDRFALAVLLFKLLMFEDMSPYQQLKCHVEEATVRGKFPYPRPMDYGNTFPGIPQHLPSGHCYYTWNRMPKKYVNYLLMRFISHLAIQIVSTLQPRMNGKESLRDTKSNLWQDKTTFDFMLKKNNFVTVKSAVIRLRPSELEERIHSCQAFALVA